MPRNSRLTKRAQQMFKLVERYHDSSLSQKAFCETERLALSTLQYWLSKYKKYRQPSSGFAQAFVQVKAQSSNPSANSGITLTYPNGVTVRLSNDVELTLLKELIRL